MTMAWPAPAPPVWRDPPGGVTGGRRTPVVPPIVEETGACATPSAACVAQRRMELKAEETKLKAAETELARLEAEPAATNAMVETARMVVTGAMEAVTEAVLALAEAIAEVPPTYTSGALATALATERGSTADTLGGGLDEWKRNGDTTESNTTIERGVVDGHRLRRSHMGCHCASGCGLEKQRL